MRKFLVVLLLAGCGRSEIYGADEVPPALMPDARVPDSGVPDSGVPDSGVPDSGVPDSGVPDSGVPDSGTPDSGLPDSGLPDAGVPDAGPNDCGRVLATGTALTAYGDAGLGPPLGAALPVCIGVGRPASCPSGALIYGSTAGDWPADVSSLGGAVWVWRPDATPQGAADFTQVFFGGTYVLTGTPHAVLWLSVDDYAEVRVNGHLVGTLGSLTDVNLAAAAHSALFSFDLSPWLVAGPNTLLISAENGGPAFAGCPGACTYQQNPAGVVFSTTLGCN